jgi:carbamoyltransferase
MLLPSNSNHGATGMLILGINLGFKLETQYNKDRHIAHDAAAVILRDGNIVAAIEEERLSRVKHCNFFPKRAIDACLTEAGARLEDVDCIALNLSEMDAQRYAQLDAFDDTRVPLRSGRDHFSALFRKSYALDVSQRLVFCRHHEAHAWSAFALSGFQECAVLVLDGGGSSGQGDDKFLSGLLGVARDGCFEVIREFTSGQSLGNFYCNAIKLIGYELFDEYKVMGLAPYGDPARFRHIFRQVYSLLPDGGYRINANYMENLFLQLGSQPGFLPIRRKHDTFTQVHKDFAASLQESVEDIVLHIVHDARVACDLPALAYAGGVAHNCTLNGKLLRSGIFDRFFVQPAAHDAGCALGAALYAQAQMAAMPVRRLDHLYLGTSLPRSSTIELELKQWRPLIDVRRSAHVTREAAAMLAADCVIGWVQGRSEFGPRALGNRSILADPRPESNKSRINQMIKKREAYRPFAPSVLEERAAELFETPSDIDNLQFMNMVVPVNIRWRERLGAITHVDHTARVQVVRKDCNARYWELINEFAVHSGVPAVLNTSLNNNNEPIVDSVADAVACFLTTDLSYLIVDDYIVSRASPVAAALGLFSIAVKPSLKVTSGFDSENGMQVRSYVLESTYGHRFGKTSERISLALFRILTLPGGDRLALRECCAKLSIDLDAKLIDEILERWSDRLLSVRPAQIQDCSAIA